MSDGNGDVPEKRGRPNRYRRLDSATVAKAVDFARTGAMNDDVAALIGVARSGFYRWLADGKEEAERRWYGEEPDHNRDLVVDLWDGMREAHAGIIAVAAGNWVQQARTDWRAGEALLTKRFMNWRPSAFDPAGPAQGAGTADDAAELAQAAVTEGQALALAGAMRRFGDSLLALVVAEGIEQARSRMGALARDALS